MKDALGDVQRQFLGDLETALDELVLLARQHDHGCTELSQRARALASEPLRTRVGALHPAARKLRKIDEEM